VKILQINAVGQYGSTGRNCKELAEYIHQNTAHSCYTAFSEGMVDAHSYQIGTPVEKKLHGLLSRVFGRQAHFSVRGTRRLLRYMDDLQPDVVHLNNLHGNYIHFPMLMRYLAKHDIATVVTLHDCWFYTGKCCHYTVDGCYRWQTGCHHCPRLRKDNVSWFRDATKALWKEKKALFEAIPRLGVVGVSDWITEEAKRSYLSCAKEIRRIYNWIDLDVFYPRENREEVRERLGLQGKKIVLGVASGWSNAKGLDQFLALADRLGDDYAVVLVGRMPTDVQLPKRVRHIPATESVEELAEYYSMADVFVTLSLEETFGKVSAEALACGTPVVCYGSTANGELAKAKGCKSCKPGNLHEVLEAVQTACVLDARVECRRMAELQFDKNKQIQAYVCFYETLLG